MEKETKKPLENYWPNSEGSDIEDPKLDKFIEQGIKEIEVYLRKQAKFYDYISNQEANTQNPRSPLN